MAEFFPDSVGSPPLEPTYVTYGSGDAPYVDALRYMIRPMLQMVAYIIVSMLEKLLPGRFQRTKEGGTLSRNGKKHRFGNASQRISLFLSHFIDWLLTSLFAVLAGLTLLAPMSVMFPNPSFEKSLNTTYIAFILFALVTGILDRKNMLSLTMAYAAVLVVLFGLSLPTS